MTKRKRKAAAETERVPARVDPLEFFSLLKWLDRKPLVIEPYRKKSFRDVFLTEDEYGRLLYSLALFLRGKKNAKSLDGVLAELFVLLNWEVAGGVTCLGVASDEAQADIDLDLCKKLIRANELLADLLEIRDKAVLRRDGNGIAEIRPGKDFAGQHGGKFDFLFIDEVHTQRDYRLLEAFAPDPTRENLTWICSYNTLYWRPGVPLFDMLQRGWKGEDTRMYFSAYTSSRTTDPDFADAEPERRANPSMDSWKDSGAYLQQQKTRLPSFMYRRLHLCEGGLPGGSAFTVEAIDAAIERTIKVRAPLPGIEQYHAFVDMSGGSNDDAVLAVGHSEGDAEAGRAVLDCILDQGAPAPFDPMKAVVRFAKVLKSYRIASVIGDAYAGETFRAAFENEGISYHVSQLTKSELYEAFEPRLNSGRVVLLDVTQLETQLLGLIGRGQKIDHPSGEHDDWSNSVVGVVHSILDDVDLSGLLGFGDRVFTRDGAIGADAPDWKDPQ
jgi:hypothetical protein